MENQFTYKTKNGDLKSYSIPDKAFNLFSQALIDYKTAKDYIYSTWIHTWNFWLKSYYMNVSDRARYIQNWQANYSLGLIRSTVDTYLSFLSDTPLQFFATALDDKAHDIIRDGKTSLDFSRDALNYIADVTRFSDEIGTALLEWVTLWNYVFKTNYNKLDKKVKYITMVDGIPTDVEVEYKSSNTPYSTSVDLYHIFPDPYNSNTPEYVFERNVISQRKFLEIFMGLIMDEDNMIKMKANDIAFILNNPNNADFADYANVRSEIMKQHNENFERTDSIYNSGNKAWTAVSSTIFEENNSENRVEFQFGCYEDHMILIANNYPVYVGDNIFGFIPYTIGTAYPTRWVFSESIPTILAGLEQTQNSFYNNLIDSARATAHPVLLKNRNAFSVDQDLKVFPWAQWTIDNMDFERSVQYLQIPQITDHGTMNLSDYYSHKLSWVSEINQGFASKVRTAAEAGALVESTNRRLNQFLKRFSSITGHVGEQWLGLARRFWQGDKLWHIKDIDWKTKMMSFSNKDLVWSCYVTLDSSWLFAMNKEMELKKQLDMFARFSWYMQPEQIKEFMRNIFRSANMNPNIFMPQEAIITKPTASESTISALVSQWWDNQWIADISQIQENAEDLTAWMTNQLDLWNQWRGQ